MDIYSVAARWNWPRHIADSHGACGKALVTTYQQLISIPSAVRITDASIFQDATVARTAIYPYLIPRQSPSDRPPFHANRQSRHNTAPVTIRFPFAHPVHVR